MFWEKDIETIDVNELKKYQINKLNETVSQSLKSVFYKERLKDA
jgi:phenylacetate-coenzyme A ligase PaaK-like adenylate-forming protein